MLRWHWTVCVQARQTIRIRNSRVCFSMYKKKAEAFDIPIRCLIGLSAGLCADNKLKFGAHNTASLVLKVGKTTFYATECTGEWAWKGTSLEKLEFVSNETKYMLILLDFSDWLVFSREFFKILNIRRTISWVEMNSDEGLRHISDYE